MRMKELLNGGWTRVCTALCSLLKATFRLKTRMHYVQRAERNLVDKRDHCKLMQKQVKLVLMVDVPVDLKVVKAFETALALLGGS